MLMSKNLIVFTLLQYHFIMVFCHQLIIDDKNYFNTFLSNSTSSVIQKKIRNPLTLSHNEGCTSNVVPTYSEWSQFLPNEDLIYDGLYAFQRNSNEISEIKNILLESLVIEPQFDSSKSLNNTIYPSLGGGSFAEGESLMLRCPILAYSLNNPIYDWYFYPKNSKFPTKIGYQAKEKAVDGENFIARFIENGRWLKLTLGRPKSYSFDDISKAGFGEYLCNVLLFKDQEIKNNKSGPFIPVMLAEQGLLNSTVQFIFTTRDRVRHSKPDAFDLLPQKTNEKVFPKCSKNETILYVEQGTTQELFCDVNFPRDDILVRWYFNGELIKFPRDRFSIVDRNRLRIKRISPQDSGEYGCHYWEYSLTSETTKVLVEERLSPSDIKSNRQNVYALADKDARFFCEFPTRNLRYKILWYHNGVEVDDSLSENGQYAIDNSQDLLFGLLKSNFTLKRAQTHHSGIVQCFILTGFNEYSKTFHISVERTNGLSPGSDQLLSDASEHEKPPSAPTHLKLDFIEDHRADVAWKKPKDETFLSYKVNLYTYPTGIIFYTRETTNERILLNELTPETSFEVGIVTKRNSDGIHSAESERLRFTTKKKLYRPGPIDKIVAEPIEGRRMKISWALPDPPKDPANSIDHYVITLTNLLDKDAAKIIRRANQPEIIIDKLMPDHFFKVTVAGITRKGTEGTPGHLSSTPRIHSETPLDFPKDFSVNSIGERVVRLKWENIKVDGEILHNLIKVHSDYWLEEKEVIARRGLTKMTLTNLLPNSIYRAQIMSVTRSGRGPSSPMIEFKTLAKANHIDRDIQMIVDRINDQLDTEEGNAIFQFPAEADYDDSIEPELEETIENRIDKLEAVPSSRSVSLSWNYLKNCDHLEIEWGQLYPGPNRMKVECNRRRTKIDNLSPNQQYMISVTPVMNGQMGKKELLEIKTLLRDLIVPTIPVSITQTSYGAIWTILNWNAPNQCDNDPALCRNYRINQYYQVRYRPHSLKDNHVPWTKVNTTERTVRIVNLIPRQQYSLSVRTVVSSDNSRMNEIYSDWSLSTFFQIPNESEIIPIITIRPTNTKDLLTMDISMRIPADFEHIQNTYSINYISRDLFLSSVQPQWIMVHHQGEMHQGPVTIANIIPNSLYILQVHLHFYDGNNEIWPLFFYKTSSDLNEQGTWFKTESRQYSLSDLKPSDLDTLNTNRGYMKDGGLFGSLFANNFSAIIGIILSVIALLLMMILCLLLCRRIRKRPVPLKETDPERQGNNFNGHLHGSLSQHGSCSPSYISDRTIEKAKMLTPNQQRNNQSGHLSIGRNNFMQSNIDPNLWINNSKDVKNQFELNSDMGVGCYPASIEPNAAGLLSSRYHNSSSLKNKERLQNGGLDSSYNRYNVNQNTPRVNANELMSHTSSEDIRPMMASSALSDAFNQFNPQKGRQPIQSSFYGTHNNSSTNSTTSSVSRRGFAHNGQNNSNSVYQNGMIHEVSSKVSHTSTARSFKRENGEGNSTIGSGSDLEEVKRDFSCTELKEEMANLEGLMKDLSSITQMDHK